MSNSLQAGFGRAVITPPMGTEISGYFVTRIADGVLDDLEINAIALRAGGDTVVMMSYDLCSVVTATADLIRTQVSEALGIPRAAVVVAADHTHTGPFSTPGKEEGGLQRQYYRFLLEQSLAAAKAAVADLKPARMGWKVGLAPNIAFVRRFRMKDGGVRTNPGVGNPDIVAPIGDVDERVGVLRFTREGAEDIVLVNFGNHPDTVGGCKISADWPGFLRRTLEKTLDDTKCVFFNGAEGDVNHVNVWAKEGDYNDLFMDFDDVARGYGHTRFMGRCMAGAVLQVYDKVNYVDVDSLRYADSTVKLPSNMPTAEELVQARVYNELHKAGKDEQIPFKGMELTTVVAEAGRMVNLANGPEAFPLNMAAVAIGPVALVAIAGEPFTGIGRGIKDTEGWDLIMPLCNANGREGYFPMQEAYDEGGYEARSSVFKAGVAEKIIAEGKRLLKEVQ